MSTGRRIRTLTFKAKMAFDETRDKMQEICDKLWSKNEDLMITLGQKSTLEDLRSLEKNIKDNFRQFCIKSEEFKGYLKRQNTTEASDLLEAYNKHFSECNATVRKVIERIKVMKKDLVEELSQVSGSSRSSASRRRARAEGEKVRLEFVKKEGELLKQKAEIEASLSIVKQESKIAVIETEAKILEGGDEQELDLFSDHVEN